VSSDLILSSMAFMRFNNSAVSWAEMANEPKQPIKTANTMRCIQSPFCGTDWYTVHEPPRRPDFCRVRHYPRNKRRKSVKRRVARGRVSQRIADRGWRDTLPPEFASQE